MARPAEWDGDVSASRPQRNVAATARAALGVLLAALLAACAGRTPGPEPPAPAASSLLALAALGTARAQIGVPYRYGGADPRAGFDCSGLVAYSYAKAGIALPRSTGAQRKAAIPLARGALAPGDLVFFRIGRQEHVGIYAGEGVFVHAPSTGGAVRRERLDDPYWTARYAGAGRIPAR